MMAFQARHSSCGFTGSPAGLSAAEREAIEHYASCPKAGEGRCEVVRVSAGQSGNRGPSAHQFGATISGSRRRGNGTGPLDTTLLAKRRAASVADDTSSRARREGGR